MQKFKNDDDAVDVQRVPIVSRTALKAAPSLRPGLAMMEGCIVGNPEAEAIRDAWRFKANRATRLILVSRQDYAQMVERTVDFGG